VRLAPDSETPIPLVAAAALTAVEGLVLVVYAVLELFSLSTGRVTMGLTTSIFFLAYGAGLLWGAWAITHGRAIARSPILLAQLIQLGLAWNFRGADTWPVSVVLAMVAVVVIAGLLSPASLSALDRED
jgi:MFS family permease